MTITGLGWVTWRQHRAQLLIVTGFLAVLGGLLLFHGLYTAGLAEQFTSGTAQRLDVLGGQFGQVSRFLIWSPVPPALVGMFWGAPLLAREYERGTHRLAWTQSVTGRAWLGVKLGGLGAGVVVAGLLFGAIMGGWASGFGELRAAGSFTNQDLFVVTGILPAAWWLFTFVLGAAAGAVIRRLLPTLAVTLAVFLVLYVALLVTEARLHYAEPARMEVSGSALSGDSAWINTKPGAEERLPVGSLLVTSGWVDKNDVPLSFDTTWACTSTSDSYLDCMRDKGFRWFAEYQPADRYWRFQVIEAGALVLASLALGALALRRTNH